MAGAARIRGSTTAARTSPSASRRMAGSNWPPPYAQPRWSLQHSRIEKRAHGGARGVSVPCTRIDHVGLDRQDGNPRLLECAFDEEAAGAGRFHTTRAQNQRAVNAMLARLVDEPLGGPWRVVQVLVEAGRAAGQGG